MENTQFKVFVTSDTHFSHTNIIKYCNRPFANAAEMNEAIIERWNSVVGPNDIVIHCGDFALGPSSDMDAIVSRLNGSIVLILGNHDHKTLAYYNKYFMKAIYSPLTLHLMTEENKCQHTYIFSHYPPQEVQGYATYYFGHVHDKIDPVEVKDNVHCICAERTDYTPRLIFDKVHKFDIIDNDVFLTI